MGTPADDPLASARLAALGVAEPGRVRQGLAAYAALLRRWARARNLVAPGDLPRLERRHLLDSLAALPLLRGPRVLDLGTGAGLPGIPLALASPALRFVLLDRRAGRTAFVEHAVAQLGLANVEVVTATAEAHAREAGARYGTVLARAVAGLAGLAALAGPLLAPGGRVVAWQGPAAAGGLAALPDGWRGRLVEASAAATGTLVVLERDPAGAAGVAPVV